MTYFRLAGPTLIVPADDLARAIGTVKACVPSWAQLYWDKTGGFLIARCSTPAPDSMLVYGDVVTGPPIQYRTVESASSSRPGYCSPRWSTAYTWYGVAFRQH